MDKIGKYEILDKIGEGGFGVVYKGKDPFIKRLVAVKTCNSENESIQKRFFREAEIAGNLHHANVVTIHDFGIEGETPYLVQEYLSGVDLDVKMRDEADSIPLLTKVQYLRGIAEGLRYAHSKGVIHRDIKPANIRILENGRVKVMDFGIAKLKDQDSQLTQTGMTLGTVSYLSPEQLKGDNIDHRADIFSYGVLAYELLSGKRPFEADTISSLFYMLLNESAPDLTRLDPDIPDPLNAAVQRCLSKEADERYPDFEQLIDELRRIEDDIARSEATSSEVEDDSTLSHLAAKTRQALQEGDLTAAELTIQMARRDHADATAFAPTFDPLVEEVQDLKRKRDEQIDQPVDLPPPPVEAPPAGSVSEPSPSSAIEAPGAAADVAPPEARHGEDEGRPAL